MQPGESAFRDGEQLKLDLFKGVPWGGVSPRGLTRVRILLSLRQEPLGREVVADPMQLELWPEAKKAAIQKGWDPTGPAPSTLLPLKGRRRSRWPRRGSHVRGD